MLSRWFLYLVVFVSVNICAFGQSSLNVEIYANQKPLALNQSFIIEGKTYKVTKWQCYFSHFIFLRNDGNQSITKYTLADLNGSKKVVSGVDSLPEVRKVSFAIGVDSAKTMEGVFEGDLDPAKGMFWTWQSGYINFKLELEDLEGNELIYHIGGFSGNQNSFRTIEYSVPENKTISGIQLDLNAVMRYVNTQDIDKIMSPGMKATRFADHYQEMFDLILK
ncbi:hypothetical protein OAH12_01030 [Cyclobacteriaceae bacterium]|nr:hypothetical protein [Cyclobacteriaceae bacterium]